MSNLSNLSHGDVIDFSAPSPKTPPPPSVLPAVGEEVNKGGDDDARLTEGVNSPEPVFQSPTASLLRRSVNNGVLSPAAASKPTSQSIYLRVMGRKPGTSAGDVPNAKPFKATPINYTIMGLFSKESNEERQIRHMLKSYKATLLAELQHCSKASVRHKKRVADQFAEFEVHEGKLVGWGLKFIIPFFRMQAWSRLSRSTLMRDLSVELEQVMTQRISKTSLYLQMFEESINRKNKYSVQGTEEFCMRPDTLLDRDMGLITMTQQLQSLDEICSSTTKRFMQFENEYAWHGQPMRRKILLRILKRYKSIPRITELTNIEEDLSWSDFCLWYANRNKIINQLELEFSDFVEDQREKEGRLFYRWHKSLYRAKEAFEAAEALAAASAAALNGSSNDVGDANAGPSVRRGSQPPRVSISQVNSFRTFDNRNSFSGQDGPSEEPNNTASTATSGVVKERGGSSDSLEATSNNAAGNATNTKGEIAPSNASGAQPAGGPSDGIIALKVTPFSIKAFIKYFANDIIGVQYEIPKDCMAANLALTEALFFRRIHSHIYQYTSQSMYASDQAWRQQCQMCRFVDPITYHVPPKYATGRSVPAAPQAASSPLPPPPPTGEKPVSSAYGKSSGQTHGPLSAPLPSRSNSEKNLQKHFEAEHERPVRSPSPPFTPNVHATATSTAGAEGSHPQHHNHHDQHAREGAEEAASLPTTVVRASSPHSTGSTASSSHAPRSRRNTASTASVSETQDNSPAVEVRNATSATEGLHLHAPQEASHAHHAHAHDHSHSHSHHHNHHCDQSVHTSSGTDDLGKSSSAAETSQTTPRSPSKPLKMRLVSDDSGIYKTCFHENHAPDKCPANNVNSPGSPVPKSSGAISLLRNSLQNLTSPSTGTLRKGLKDDLSGPTPTKFVVKDPAVQGENETSPMNLEAEKDDYFHTAIDDPSPRNNTAHSTSSHRLRHNSDLADDQNEDINNSSVHVSGFDPDEDPANTISSYHMGGLDANATSPAQESHTSALDQIAGIKGIPLHPAPGDKNFGPKGRLGTASGSVHSSAHRSHHRKGHHGGSPRSYLTANALKANDRALTAPTCTCKMCATFAAAARLQRLPKYTEGQYGIAYARSSRVMSFLVTASTPGEIINVLALASKWLLRDAIDASGSRDTIGADLLVPLFTMVLINAQLPNVHMILQVLLDYGEYNEQGDVSYTIANLEGSILFILGLEVSPQALLAWEQSTYANNNSAFSMANRNHRGVSSSRDIKSKYSSDKLNELVRQGTNSTCTNVSSNGAGSNDQNIINNSNTNNNTTAGGNNGNNYAHSASTPAFTEMSFAAKSKDDHTDDDVQAMKQLGEWLRDQNTMEDTITILQKEGWMA